MNILALPSEINAMFLERLDLASRSKLACTCKYFKRLANDGTLLLRCLNVTDMKIANATFFKRFFDYFTLTHLIEFNFNRITYNDLDDLDENNPKRIKMIRAARLLFAINCSQMFTDIQNLTSGLRFSPYFHKCSIQPLEQTFETLKVSSSNQQTKLQEVENKLNSYFKVRRDLTKEQKPYRFEITHELFLKNHYSMELYDFNFLTELYQCFFSKINLNKLNFEGVNSYTTQLYNYIPTSMFHGLCRAIKANSKPFGGFHYFELSEKHLQAWNEAFENREIKSLWVSLLEDVTSETLKKFAEIILNLDPDITIRVMYICPKESGEVEQLFQSFIPKMKNRTDTEWVLNLSRPF